MTALLGFAPLVVQRHTCAYEGCTREGEHHVDGGRFGVVWYCREHCVYCKDAS